MEKNIQNHAKLRRRKELGGKTGVLEGLDLPSAGGGTEAGGPTPTFEQLSESEEKYLRLRVKQLICGSLNGMRIRQSLPQHASCRQERWPPGWGSGWELQLSASGAIPGRELLLNEEMDQGDVGEEIVMGDVRGGKPGSHGSRATLLNHA